MIVVLDVFFFFVVDRLFSLKRIEQNFEVLFCLFIFYLFVMFRPFCFGADNQKRTSLRASSLPLFEQCRRI